MGSKPKYGKVEATWKENSRTKTTQLMMTFPSDMLSIDFHIKGKTWCSLWGNGCDRESWF